MTQERLQRLLPVAKAKYEAEFAQVRHLIAAEGRYRTQLARLDALAKEVREQSLTPGPMQVLGVDVLFEKSLDHNRTLLNVELAKVLALKLQAMDKVRHAFGRKQAIETAEAKLAQVAKKKKASRQREAALKPWLDGSL